MADLQTRTSSALRALADRETAERTAAERTGASTVNVPRSLESATAVAEELAAVAANVETALGGVYTHPSISTDNALSRYNGTGGNLQNSGVTLDDSASMDFAGGRVRSVGVAEVSASEPSPTATGQLWLDTGTGVSGASGLLALVTTTTTPFTVANTHTVIRCDCTAVAIAVNLPTAVGIGGKVYYIKKVDSTVNAVTIAADGAELIDGQSTQSIVAQYNSLMVVSDAGWGVY